MTFNIRTMYTQKPVRLALRLWGAADQCTMSQVPISIPWHSENWNIQLKAHLNPLMIPMHGKFNDDIFARFLEITKNVAISFIKEYWGPILIPSCDVIDDVNIMKNTFLDIIWGRHLIISKVKPKLCLIFQILQNGHLFELATNFFIRSDTGSWRYQQCSRWHFRYFELLIDALAQILTGIYQFQILTYFVTCWRHQWRHEYAFIQM